MKSLTLRHRQHGISLVLTLALVVIATFLVTGFLVATRLNQTATSSAAGSIQAEEIASGALELLTDNLRREIAAGSTATTAVGASTANLYLPNSTATMVPRRLGFNTNDALLANLVRVSSSADVPANYPSPAYDQSLLTGRLGASAAPEAVTTSPSSSRDGRFIGPSRWLKTQLLPADAPFPAPAWVTVTRTGTKPGAADPDVPGPGGLADAAIANGNACIGRVAYAIYDQGGLLNVNLAGFPSSIADARVSGGKNAASWADLTQLGLTATQIDTLVAWRNAASGASAASFQNHVYNNAPANGFTQVRAGDNAFLSRQELIRYFQTELSSANVLPSLGTFSYTINAPSYTAGSAQAARYFYDDGSGAKPLRRFPLNTRLELLNSGTDAATIGTAFGLTARPGWQNPSARLWNYPDTAINSVEQALAAGREPNFFEVLKTAILQGSLGTQGGIGARSSMSWEDGRIDNQIIRLGANIIDQYDADNFPTTIRFGGIDFFGIENLPYFSEMILQVVCPEAASNEWGATLSYSSATGTSIDLKNYFYFELWNPHQAPVSSVPGPTQLRIRKDAGTYQIGLVLNYNYVSGPWSVAPQPWPSSVIEVNPATTDYRATPRVVSDGATNLVTLGTSSVNAFVISRSFNVTGTASNQQVQAANVYERTVFALEYFDGANWRPYTTLSGLADGNGTGGLFHGGTPPGVYANSPWVNAVTGAMLQPSLTWPKPDPRTDRLGISAGGGPGPDGRARLNNPMICAAAPYASGGFDVWSSLGTYTGSNRPGTLVTNRGTAQAADRDNINRPGDAFLSAPQANPMTVPAARPVILNRSFRSVGELGYVFRDQPWKTINLFSTESADAALLDAFCLEDTELIAGQTSLNTRNTDALLALMSGASTSQSSTSERLATDLDAAANALAAFTANNPAVSPADLVTGFMGSTASLVTGGLDSPESPVKLRREAVVRALASTTQTRTWNLLVDLIAQSGRFAPKATRLGDFIVQSERRYWVHLAIDRFTGEVIARQIEPVQE